MSALCNELITQDRSELGRSLNCGFSRERNSKQNGKFGEFEVDGRFGSEGGCDSKSRANLQL
jgi:hypothetical protein